MKVIMVCSSGGHLDQLMLLTPPPAGVHIEFATFGKPDALAKTEGYPTTELRWPTNRNLPRTVANIAIAVRHILRFRPAVVISSGASPAVSYFVVARLLRTRCVYIECFDRIDLPTMTARILCHLRVEFIVQWDSQLPGWPNRTHLGRSM